ncbi:hypothetical protein ACFWM2_14250, partial [Streptomyces sp. NPDC058371]
MPEEDESGKGDSDEEELDEPEESAGEESSEPDVPDESVDAELGGEEEASDPPTFPSNEPVSFPSPEGGTQGGQEAK